MSTVLFVAHEPDMVPGHLGVRAAHHGHDVAVLDVAAGEPFPDPTRYDRVVLLGSRRSAYDDTVAHVAAELAFIRAALADDVPLLGVCFGGQLLARALGGRVWGMAEPEIGWQEVETSDPAVVPRGPWLVWHGDAFAVPDGAVPLARTDRAAQAFSHGRAVALQFHPEVTEAVVGAWIAAGVGGLDPDGPVADGLLAGARRYGAAARAAAYGLYDALEEWWPTAR